METYQVRTVRLAGTDPISRRPVPQQEETLPIQASSEHDAYKQSFRECRIPFTGQDRQVYVNGRLHLGNF